MFAYRVGWPLWKFAAHVGVPVSFLVCIHRDNEAGVYFAHSDELRGLVVEATTLDELRTEWRAAAQALLDAALDGHPPRAEPQLRFVDDALCAA